VIEKQDRAGLGISKFLDDLDAALPQLLELLEFFDFFLESLQSLVLCLEGVARSGEPLDLAVQVIPVRTQTEYGNPHNGKHYQSRPRNLGFYRDCSFLDVRCLISEEVYFNHS